MAFGHETGCDPLTAPCRYCIAGEKIRAILKPKQLKLVAGIVADLTIGRNVAKHSADLTKRAKRFVRQAKATAPKKRGRPRKVDAAPKKRGRPPKAR